MRTLHLVLKRKWFEMIASGEKQEEYRDTTLYWAKRLMKFQNDVGLSEPFQVTFQLGYQKNDPRITFEIKKITIGKGREEWGAEPNKKYFIIKLGKRI